MIKTFYKVCIVFTTIIALFFFVRWINDVRPKYEWQEKFVVENRIDYFGDDRNKYCDFVDIKYTKDWIVPEKYRALSKEEKTEYEIVSNNHIISFGYYKFSTTTRYICYIKDKVKIN